MPLYKTKRERGREGVDDLREYISSNEPLSSTIGIELTSAAKGMCNSIRQADDGELLKWNKLAAYQVKCH